MNKMKTLKMLAAAGVVLALAACGGGSDGDGGSGGGNPVVGQNGTVNVSGVSMSGGESCGIGGFAQALLAEINAARSKARKCGSTAMPAAPAIGYWNTLLQQAAVKHSSDMASKNFFSHTGSDGSQPHDRAASAGYQGGVGENLHGYFGSAVSLVSAKRTVERALASDGHCQNVMSEGWKEIAAACSKSGSKAYVTVIFGSGQ